MPLPEQPYQPLRPYDADAEALFIGRENDLQQLALTIDLAETRLLVLHGGAAVGKSSLLRAGLVPFLDEDCVGYRVLGDRSPPEAEDKAAEEERVPLTVRSGGDLAGQLALALEAFCAQPYRLATPTGRTVEIDGLAVLTTLGEGLVKTSADGLVELDTDMLAEALERDPGLLGRALAALTERLPFELVIVIEQGEELFTLAKEEESLPALKMLRQAAQGMARVKWVIGVRTEFLGRLLHYLQPQTATTPWLGDYLLKDLDSDALLEALLLPTLNEPLGGGVETPHQKYDFQFEQGLADKVVEEVLKAAAQRQLSAAMLVQVVGMRLFERLANRQERVVRAGDLRALGRIPESPTRFVQSRLRRLPRQMGDRSSFQKLLGELLVRQADGSSVRNLVPLTDLQKEWRGSTPLQTMVLAAAADDVGLLEVQELNVHGHEDTYVGLVSDTAAVVFAQEAVAEEKKQYGTSRMMDALWITIPLMILMAVATYTLLWLPYSVLKGQSEELENFAKKAKLANQTLESEVLAQSFPAYLANVQLAQQALEGGDAVKLRQYLLRCQDMQIYYPDQGDRPVNPRGFDWYHLWQQANMEQKSLVGHRGQVTSVAVSADGKTAVSGSLDQTVRLWNLEKGLERVLFKSHAGPVLAVVLSPDGKQVASASADGVILLWDATVAKDTFQTVEVPKATLKGHEGAVTALAYAADGKTLVSGGADKTIRFWDAVKGQEKQKLTGITDQVTAATFAPDGKTLASAAEQTVLLWTVAADKAEAKPAKTLKHDSRGSGSGLFSGR